MCFRVEHWNGPLTPLYIDCKQFRIVDFQNFTLTIEAGDNCVLLDEKEIVRIENLIEYHGKPFIIERSFGLLKNLYPDPFNSTDLDIYHCSVLSHQLQVWPIELVKFKMYLMPLSGLQAYAAYPIENL